MNLRRYLLLIFLITLTGCVQPETSTDEFAFETANPAEVGMSPDSLSRVTQFLETFVEENKIPGAVAMIVKDGRIVYRESTGYSDRETDEMMSEDHIFRLASMTKAITSTGILMLAERRELDIDDPVSDYIPEFANSEVLVSVNLEETTWVSEPAQREVTLHDLLTHTSGIAYGFTDPTMQAIYQSAGVPDGGASGVTISETMAALGELPLLHEPGERWTYGLSTDVLGRVIEVASGRPLNLFLKEEIFDPLGMDDTRFIPDEGMQNRLVTMYRNPDPNELQRSSPLRAEGAEETETSSQDEITYFSGGSGLVSTAENYQRFMQAVLNGGTLGETQIFGEEVTQWLQNNQMGDLRVGTDGFSYGFRVTLPDSDLVNGRLPGRLDWSGLFQTVYWLDPARNATVVLMTQVYPSLHQEELYDGFEMRVNRSYVN